MHAIILILYSVLSFWSLKEFFIRLLIIVSRDCALLYSGVINGAGLMVWWANSTLKCNTLSAIIFCYNMLFLFLFLICISVCYHDPFCLIPPCSLMCLFGLCICVLWVQMKLMKLLQRLPASVVRRLHRERYKKPCWITPIPSSHRLTDDNITEFVESMKQPVLMAIFSKTGSMDAAQALQNLALMRPELVIPPVLEKWVPYLDLASSVATWELLFSYKDPFWNVFKV